MNKHFNPRNLKEWMELLADWLLLNPGAPLKDAAKHFNVTPGYISMVKNSDVFKLYWEQRTVEFRKEVNLVAVEAMSGIQQRSTTMTELALDHLISKVDTIGTIMEVEQLQSIAELGLKSLGYGANKNSAAPGVNVTINAGVVGRDELERARQRMREVHGVLPTALPASGGSASPSTLISAHVDELVEIAVEQKD